MITLAKSVLVIEDEDALRTLIAEILQSKGYQVTQAADGLYALEQLERHRPKLILLDMRMPRMNGWTFAAELKRRNIPIPIVVLTAAEDAQARAREIDAQGWISKPFDFEELLAEVGKHFAKPPA